MTPEVLVLRVSLLLIGTAAVGLWQLRDGTALSRWLDRKVADSGHLPQPNIVRTDRYL